MPSARTSYLPSEFGWLRSIAQISLQDGLLLTYGLGAPGLITEYGTLVVDRKMGVVHRPVTTLSLRRVLSRFMSQYQAISRLPSGISGFPLWCLLCTLLFPYNPPNLLGFSVRYGWYKWHSSWNYLELATAELQEPRNARGCVSCYYHAISSSSFHICWASDLLESCRSTMVWPWWQIHPSCLGEMHLPGYRNCLGI